MGDREGTGAQIVSTDHVAACATACVQWSSSGAACPSGSTGQCLSHFGSHSVLGGCHWFASGEANGGGKHSTWQALPHQRIS